MSDQFNRTDGVKEITPEDMGKLGVHEQSGKLYWEGKEIYTRKKVSLRWYELLLASITAFSAGLLVLLEIYRTFCIV